jgi:uncharacterized membrane protein YkvA (DUF1232 family)
MASKFKVTFTLDESDANYFRKLYRKAKKEAEVHGRDQIIEDARAIVKEVNSSKKTPSFVQDAITTLADLVDLIQDDDYDAPQRVQTEVLAALAYFSEPEDLIPDNIPGLGFLDDAIMVKFIEEEFKNELWGYRRFCKNRDASEQRPWAASAKERLAERLAQDRKKIRGAIVERDAKEALKKKSKSHGGW